MHYGTFQLTPEGLDEPVRELKHALAGHGLSEQQFKTLEVGESFVLVGSTRA
jgi:hypothetical protein